MKHFSEYRNPEVARKLLAEIKDASQKQISLMEVCGTHTVSIFRSGIRDILPKNISLISGPGCPVCVTSNQDIDLAITIARQPGVILATFGDMIKVPGSESSLENERAEGSDIRVVYSSLNALDIAFQNPDKEVVLLGIGFETTSPTIASAILTASERKTDNFYVLSTHKIIPPAMKAILDAEEVMINGFLCPGHVSAIIGTQPYEFIPEKYGVPCVIAGFEPLDILQGILSSVRQIQSEKAEVEIAYRRVVNPQGNPVALKILNQVFRVCDASWRGLGVIPMSGLEIRDEYQHIDARKHFDINVKPGEEPKGCLCGEVLRGVKNPTDCGFFGKKCTPENPVGPCMVSSEGTCAAYYKYGGI